jgi:transcriptional regulator with XRE-family HTH domain
MSNANPLEMGARIIRFARERQGMSQDDLSELSGVTQSLISRYEAGLVEPSLRTVQRLLNAAGVVMTIDVDGVRMIDTTRMPTEEEAEAIERLSRRIVGDPPRGTWKRRLSGFRDVGPAFPKRRSDGA